MIKHSSEIKLECIVVNTSAIKRTIDDLLQRLFDTLIWTLRHSINTQTQVISVYYDSIKKFISKTFERIFFALDLLVKIILFEAISRFLNDAIKTLSSRPQTSDEIAEANYKHTQFAKTNNEVRFSAYFLV